MVSNSLEIHNLLEEEVARAINEICDDDERNETERYCTARLCRLDAICYVLNRIPPRYVSSARGAAYVERNFSVDQQLSVDIMTLAHEALHRVTSVQRTYYREENGSAGEEPQAQAYFNFPTIKGRLFNAVNFEPITDVDLYLLRDSEPVAMFDSRWQNPYHLVSSTYGTYLFWPKPVAAEKAGEEEIFAFELFAEREGFETFRHFFSLKLSADSQPTHALKGGGEYNMSDLYMLPK